MCHLLAKAYEMAARRAEKCILCAFVAFLLSVPVVACATDAETESCIGSTVPTVPEQIVIQLPNTPICWILARLIGRDPPTPRTFAVAFANSAANATGANVRFR